MTISRDEYKTIIDNQLDGKLQIMIDLSVWRQFICGTNSRELCLLVKRSVIAQITLIRILSWIWAPILLISVGAAIPAFGWWAAVVCPLTIVGAVFYKSRASMGRQYLGPVSILLLFILSSIFIWPSWSLSTKSFLLALAVALFLIRFLYFFTARFVFGLIHSSYEFFSKFYLKPAEKVGDVVIPLIWTEPEWERHYEEL